MKYSCLVFSEGGKDKKFLMALIPLLEKYHAKQWSFNYDNASGSSPDVILGQCKKSVWGKCYDLVLCFIDLDNLKTHYPTKWKEKKQEIDQAHLKFNIIWQIDNLEDEFKKVLGDQCCGKYKLNQIAKQKVKEFKNSDFWKRILKAIKDKERELKQ